MTEQELIELRRLLAKAAYEARAVAHVQTAASVVLSWSSGELETLRGQVPVERTTR